ncbi:MAG: hydroxyacylglutathione hydrolase, partial [Chlamydiia bacterium]|nr:hydroxyacylglutathione hydrolase [Chlamydiia bacterium]
CIEGSSCIAIDPGESLPVKKFLEQHSLSLRAVLLTHHHPDHMEGCRDLQAPLIIGPEDSRFPFPVRQEPLFGFSILQLPGHTSSHIGFHHEKEKLLFCGDVLFGGGCGRVFEGTYLQMWESLKTIRALDEETLIYFGHEYTQNNLAFALSLLPDDPEIRRRYETLPAVTTPTPLALEKKTNLFLRADDPALAAALGMEGSSPLEVFTYLRDARNRW